MTNTPVTNVRVRFVDGTVVDVLYPGTYGQFRREWDTEQVISCECVFEGVMTKFSIASKHILIATAVEAGDFRMIPTKEYDELQGFKFRYESVSK